MERKLFSGIMLTLLLTGMSTLAFNIQQARADWTWTETIYIRADGSVEPDTAPISTVDNITYTLTDNIVVSVLPIENLLVVERDNIVVDGAGYRVWGTGSGIGLDISWRSNVTIKNTAIKSFALGIGLYYSSNISISGNNITNNGHGIWLYESSNNTIYHNNFIDNTQQVDIHHVGYANFWDDGYPSGGNFWSDYTTRYPDAQELDGSGIWDTPYVIDGNNQDNYPLMETWTPSPPIPRTIDELKTEIEKCWSEGEIDNQGIAKSLLAKLNVAQKLVDKGKIDEAKSILEDDFIIQVQNLSGIHITVEAADILIKSAEYVISHL